MILRRIINTLEEQLDSLKKIKSSKHFEKPHKLSKLFSNHNIILDHPKTNLLEFNPLNENNEIF